MEPQLGERRKFHMSIVIEVILMSLAETEVQLQSRHLKVVCSIHTDDKSALANKCLFLLFQHFLLRF
jgi:hypothetical protein